jgi:glutamate/tyrosine decarboxylase-like PLP-dependent enzyme
MLDLDPETRRTLFQRLYELVEDDLASTQVSAPSADLPPDLAGDPAAVLEILARGLREGIVRTGDPRYFGLFNPATSPMGVLADALVAAANPQLATRSHAPWPVDLEERTLKAIGTRFGYPAEEIEGTFTTGGAEANATALHVALHEAHPDLARRGLRGLDADPTLYVSAEGHPTVARAARLAGLGSDAVRSVPVDAGLRMKTGALRAAIAHDRSSGRRPFLIVATAGTTSAGAIDPLDEIATIAARESVWLHVDAAYGGIAAIVAELSTAIAGIARADSVTFDAHKGLAAPMGAGIYLSRRPGALSRAFHDRAGYMPRDASRDPYARSMQWSRRFVGAKVWATIEGHGWSAIEATLRAQIALGERLRVQLRERGWTVVNETPLPVVCFVDDRRPDGRRGAFLGGVSRSVLAAGAGWITVTRLSNGTRALRAGIVNHRTREAHVDRLVEALDDARRSIEVRP